MKFNRALPVVLAAFSQGVHSQKVDPFASSAVGTAKDDVSPITNSDPSETTTPTEHLQIKESIANERALNEVCKKFVNYRALDGTTLQQWCSSHSCCQGPNACTGWSTVATYEVCKNTCNNVIACRFVAEFAGSGATIKFDEGSCNGAGSCFNMAYKATNLQTLVVGKNSCTNKDSCFSAAYNAESLKQLFIADEQCKSRFGCKTCGGVSTFDDTLQLAETCCKADPGDKDPACNYFDLTSNQPSNLSSSIPSTSSIPSDQPSPLPSLVPSNIPSDSPSDQPSFVPSAQPSNQPSSEPTWVDDEQCKKKDPENDICMKLDGRCKIDCVEDENYVCVPGLCSYDKKWDKPTKKPKLRELMNKEKGIVEMEVVAIGNIGRELKTPKAPKATKAPKSSCACRVPKRNKCN